MDDFIVIILTLIILVIGAVGQIKRRKLPQPEPNDEQENKADDFWDVMEEFGMPPKQPSVIRMPEEEPEVEMEEHPKQPEYTFSAEEEGQNSVIKNESKEDKIIQNINVEKKEKIKDTFSLRKAVIYSEILNRKYT